MRQRLGRALGAALATAFGITAYLLYAANTVPDHVTVLPWPGGEDDPGGWSGIEIDSTGTRFWTVTDGAVWGEGRLERAPDGTLERATLDRTERLLGPDGAPLDRPYHDSEDIRRNPAGQFAVPFEWQHRVLLYDQIDGPAEVIPSDPRFAFFRGNTGIEAVAFDRAGMLMAFRERATLFTGPQQSFLWPRTGGWIDGFEMPGGAWSVVSADIGPDGALYTLERRFRILGFASRIRRMSLTGMRPADTVETLYHARLGRHGNLEGLALWTDAMGRLRALMVTDDNRQALQRAQLVEVILPLETGRSPR